MNNAAGRLALRQDRQRGEPPLPEAVGLDSPPLVVLPPPCSCLNLQLAPYLQFPFRK